VASLQIALEEKNNNFIQFIRCELLFNCCLFGYIYLFSVYDNFSRVSYGI